MRVPEGKLCNTDLSSRIHVVEYVAPATAAMQRIPRAQTHVPANTALTPWARVFINGSLGGTRRKGDVVELRSATSRLEGKWRRDGCKTISGVRGYAPTSVAGPGESPGS